MALSRKRRRIQGIHSGNSALKRTDQGSAAAAQITFKIAMTCEP
jgi:hypothetical protein